MSPAVWLFMFFLLLGVLTPIVFIISRDNNESNETNPGNEPGNPEETETPESPEIGKETDEMNLDNLLQDEEEDAEDADESNHTESGDSEEAESVDPPSLSSKEEERDDHHQEFPVLPDPEEDPDEQIHYNDRNDPDDSSKDLRSAVEWLVKANTEAIHEASKRRTFLGHLRNFIRAPRAEGALLVAETPWRDETPNMSRLIGERFLVMTLGLSSYGNANMDAHREALTALLGDDWSEDELESPLLYQSVGRLGLLTPTSTSSLVEELRSRITAQTIRGSEPSPSQIAHYHSLIAAVSPGEEYPFPRSEKDLSRLWHWDEHNPPLAEVDYLPAVMYGLWVHYQTGGSTSQAANDFGAMLGNWWEEKDPSTDYIEENPAIWRSILLTAWVILADQPIIWDQLRNRFDKMELQMSFLRETTETIFDWVNYLQENDEEPKEALDRNVLPPIEWIRPLASDLISEHSTPSFEYPQSWCEQMSQPERPTVEDL